MEVVTTYTFLVYTIASDLLDEEHENIDEQDGSSVDDDEVVQDGIVGVSFGVFPHAAAPFCVVVAATSSIRDPDTKVPNNN